MGLLILLLGLLIFFSFISLGLLLLSSKYHLLIGLCHCINSMQTWPTKFLILKAANYPWTLLVHTNGQHATEFYPLPVNEFSSCIFSLLGFHRSLFLYLIKERLLAESSTFLSEYSSSYLGSSLLILCIIFECSDPLFINKFDKNSSFISLDLSCLRLGWHQDLEMNKFSIGQFIMIAIIWSS